MFTKRVILTKDILSVQRNKRIYKTGGIHSVTMLMDDMVLTMNDGKQINIETSDEMFEAMEHLLENDEVEMTSIEKIKCAGEKPVEGITALTIVGSLFLLLGSYGYIIQLLTRQKTNIEKVLFSYGYEGYFWLGAVILSAICIIGIYIWRGRENRKKRNRLMIGKLWFWLSFLPIMYVYVEYDNKFNEFTKSARADYQLYQNGEYEHTTTNGIAKVEIPYQAWGDYRVYDYMDCLSISYEFIKISDDADISFDGEYLPELIVIESSQISFQEENVLSKQKIYY